MPKKLFLQLFVLYAISGFFGYQSVAYTLWYITPPSEQATIPIGNASNLLASAEELFSSQAAGQKERLISQTSIVDAVPLEGKFVSADLVNMKLALYQDGQKINEFDIQSKGRPGTPWETPSGFYSIKTKEKNHFSSIGEVYMPYSMQFYGNYFIHGWTLYPDGTPTSSNYSGGCIKLHTEDAEQVFGFVTIGTQVFVYDKKPNDELAPLLLERIPTPTVSAQSFLIADIDTGDVYLEKNAQVARPIASITKLMTALVANESISLYKKLTVKEGGLVNPPDYENGVEKIFVVGDLLYPLLMQSSNLVADTLASYYGTTNFVGWMNATAIAHGMQNTVFADASGASAKNISTSDDLFRLAVYIANKKAFLFQISATQNKNITATDGSSYEIKNLNAPANGANYIGGKVGHTTAAGDTSLAVLSIPEGNDTHRVAIIVLGSNDRVTDTTRLAEWITKSVTIAQNPIMGTPACVGCAQNETPEYRKVEIGDTL